MFWVVADDRRLACMPFGIGGEVVEVSPLPYRGRGKAPISGREVQESSEPRRHDQQVRGTSGAIQERV
jgi:hypothetical protein